MLGAIIGDIVGSIYEFDNQRSKVFPFWGMGCEFTDDTVMTLAVSNVCCWRKSAADPTEKELRDAFEKEMHRLGRAYPDRGYGGRFLHWLESDHPRPYNSLGNGSAMRVSPVAFAAETLEECLDLARISAEPTHNHPEGVIGAQAAAAAGWLARHGSSKDEIRSYIEDNYYSLDFTLDGIRHSYRFNEICRDTVPQAIEAFLESADFEDAIRNAISIGGDSDTLAAITGGIAEAYYGIPEALAVKALSYLPPELVKCVKDFYRMFPPR